MRGGVSVRHGPLGLRYAEVAGSDDIGVAFVLRRTAGRAVLRNRCRRRIKGWLSTETVVPVRPGVYLMSVGAAAVVMDYEELSECLKQLFEKLDSRMRRLS